MDVGGADGIGRSCVLGADGIGRHWTYGIAEPGSLYTASPVVCKRTRNMQHGRWRVRRLATRVTGRILIGAKCGTHNSSLTPGDRPRAHILEACVPVDTGCTLPDPVHRVPIHKGFFQEQDPSRQAENEGEAASRVHVRPLFVKRWPATNKAGR